MPLVRLPEPFDRPDWLYEIKYDGFRALAHVDGHRCRLVSRRGYVFSNWDALCTDISHSIRVTNAILDGEIVCLDADGRSNFYNLLFRRGSPYFYAFDLRARGAVLQSWRVRDAGAGGAVGRGGAESVRDQRSIGQQPGPDGADDATICRRFLNR